MYTELDIYKEIECIKHENGIVCPKCNGKNVVKYGKFSGKQRYKCKECKITFNSLTFTPFSRTHFPEKWDGFIECVLKGNSLRKSGEVLGVSYVTLFYWRHKLMKGVRLDKMHGFIGPIEADEMYFLYSEKGNKRKKSDISRISRTRYNFQISEDQVCVIAAMDSYKNLFSKIACMGQIKRTDIEKTIGNYLNKNSILYTDNWREYVHFAKIKGLKHYRHFETGSETNIFNVKIFKFIRSTKKWIRRFRGVATKYLENYLEFHKFLYDKNIIDIQNILLNILNKVCINPVNETYLSLNRMEFSIE